MRHCSPITVAHVCMYNCSPIIYRCTHVPQMRKFLVASSLLFVFIGLVDICQLLNSRNNIFDMLHGQGPTFSWSRFNATCAFDLISALLAVRILFPAAGTAARAPSRSDECESHALTSVRMFFTFDSSALSLLDAFCLLLFCCSSRCERPSLATIRWRRRRQRSSRPATAPVSAMTLFSRLTLFDSFSLPVLDDLGMCLGFSCAGRGRVGGAGAAARIDRDDARASGALPNNSTRSLFFHFVHRSIWRLP